MNRIRKLVWTATAAFIVTMATAVGCGAIPAHAKTLTIGTIGEEVAEEIRVFAPLASYLVEQLAIPELDAGRVVVAPGIVEMADRIKAGQVDIYIDSPLTSVAVNHLAGSTMRLRRWKKGIAEYHSIIFVRRESDFQSLVDLKGRMVAFEEPFSTSSYLLPKMIMTQAGLVLEEKRHFTETVSGDTIGYVFSNDDQNTLLWCRHAKVAAGAMNFQSFEKMVPGWREEFRLLKETPAIPRHVVNFRGDLNADMTAAIIDIMIAMEESVHGREVLAAFEKTTRFDRLDPDTTRQLLAAYPFIADETGIQP